MPQAENAGKSNELMQIWNLMIKIKSKLQYSYTKYIMPA